MSEKGYKISKESVDKVYKLNRVEITDEDILGEATKSLEDFIFEAHKEALKNGIRANTVMLNKRLAKTNGFAHAFIGGFMDIPPMICGLEAYVTDEIPNEFAFCLAEAPSTQRDQVYGEGHKKGYEEGYEQGVRDMAERLKKYYNSLTGKTMTAAVAFAIKVTAEELLKGG